ncbi:MAG: hypothetical protein COB13_009900 [OCS116 cluster bacterium]|nr:hypothetical protein [OCS116 cluster bacterium]
MAQNAKLIELIGLATITTAQNQIQNVQTTYLDDFSPYKRLSKLIKIP